jgi:hypothetical protein
MCTGVFEGLFDDMITNGLLTVQIHRVSKDCYCRAGANILAAPSEVAIVLVILRKILKPKSGKLKAVTSAGRLTETTGSIECV